ncbi:MAG: L-seryl-tRNA(Sec) selenium transferase [Myxococcota bacterium]
MDLGRPVNSDARRSLPSIDRLMRAVAAAWPELPAWAVRKAARTVVQALREGSAARDGAAEEGTSALDPAAAAGSGLASDASTASATASAPAMSDPVEPTALLDRIADEARRLATPHPRRVLNATGILLHTNLGRAPLAAHAREAVARAAHGYSDLELDLETGRRGSRMGQLAAKLVELSGAEAALVVNNNAAALLLALNTLAMGRPVVVSRGELVEIGGSFRVPEVMERAGVRLHEIGTTNRTHLADYEAALSVGPALLLKVHRSNFEQRGFVAEADVAGLAGLAHRHGLPLVEDLGSGTLVDLARAGLPPEAFVPARLALGVDVVCFSGDKLLGGPQAGILLGRRDLVEAMRRNPLARALRIDKLTLAALDATLDLLLEPERLHEIPMVAALVASEEGLRARAERLRAALASQLLPGFDLALESSVGAVGGGSLPELALPGVAVVLRGPGLEALRDRLRGAPTPVIARIADDALRLDVRTLEDDELPLVVASFVHAFR